MKDEASQKIDAGKTMAEMWEGFYQKVMEGEAAVPRVPPQYRDMQAAFYSGALCLFNWFMVQLDPEDEPTEADLGRVSRMDDEIKSFFAKRFAGRPQ